MSFLFGLFSGVILLVLQTAFLPSINSFDLLLPVVIYVSVLGLWPKALAYSACWGCL